MKIINGKLLAEIIEDKIVKEIININDGDVSCPKRPGLAIILVGDREDSKLYVKLKEREAKIIGIDTSLYKCDESISEDELITIIDCLNIDKNIDAILIQLPLPKKFNTDKIIAAMNPEKDVDRFHPINTKTLLETCNHDHVMPPVFATVIEMLKSINYNVENKKTVIIANSDLFGNGLAKVLECLKAKTIIVNFNDKDLAEKTKTADLLITAVGKPEFIKKEMIKKGAVIIDIGITKEDKFVMGDVDFEDVKDKAEFITPVPGGVGPMTIAMLFKNTLELYKKRHKLNSK